MCDFICEYNKHVIASHIKSLHVSYFWLISQKLISIHEFKSNGVRVNTIILDRAEVLTKDGLTPKYNILMNHDAKKH